VQKRQLMFNFYSLFDIKIKIGLR